MKYRIILVALFISAVNIALATNKKTEKSKQIEVVGKVYELCNDELQPLSMAFVYVNNTEFFSHSGAGGRFIINVPANTKKINISYKGYCSKTIKVNKNSKEQIEIILKKI